jgi:hypothetical protein
MLHGIFAIAIEIAKLYVITGACVFTFAIALWMFDL